MDSDNVLKPPTKPIDSVHKKPAVKLGNLSDLLVSQHSKLTSTRTFVKMKDQTLCIEIEGKYYKWIYDSPQNIDAGHAGELYVPSSNSIMMGTAEAALNPKLYLVYTEDKNLKLYIGSQDAAANLDGLRETNVHFILNVATGIQVPHSTNIEYLTVPILDEPNADIKSSFLQTFEFIDKGLESGASVLVHCNQGVSRSATVCIAYIMKKYNINFQTALAALKASKSDVKPNEGFVEQLKRYEKELGY